VAPTSSTTRKAARLAQKGKGKRVRFQGGTIFPLVVAIVLVLGVALIAYARASQPEASASPPQPGIDHWHAAYGFQICTDEPELVFTGNLEERDANGVFVNREFNNTGVHSHDDGVIHWHPYTQRAAGNRADLGIFWDNYGLEISDDEMTLPVEGMVYQAAGAPLPDDYQYGHVEDGETKCGDETGDLRVVVWDDANDSGSSNTYTANFGDIPMQDGAVVVVAFVPDDVDIVMPSWAADLERLGAADTSQATQGSAPDTAVDGTGVDGTETADTEVDGTEAVSAQSQSGGTTEPVSAATGPPESGVPATTSGD
jgi:hypothetical protein